jgi:hypothetical protein
LIRDDGQVHKGTMPDKRNDQAIRLKEAADVDPINRRSALFLSGDVLSY